jgi:hypothetical protein
LPGHCIPYESKDDDERDDEQRDLQKKGSAAGASDLIESREAPKVPPTDAAETA